MSLTKMSIIWCDASFQHNDAYGLMKNEFNQTTTGTLQPPIDPVDMDIFNEGREELLSNDIPFITVSTTDDAKREIEKHRDKKIFVICSGTIGRYLVPEIVSKYHYVHNFYIFTHNIVLHLDWADRYTNMIEMFDFHTTLLLRLTRDIAHYFIERGKGFLSLGAPRDALMLFKHAQKLEITANERDSKQSNSQLPLFRDHLDLLEDERGLIVQAEDAIRAQGYSLETS